MTGVQTMTIDNVVNGDDKVKEEFKLFLDGEKTPVEAVMAIQEAVGPLSGYRYKANTLTISNCTNRYSIPLREGNRRFMEKVEEFKAAVRILAKQNGVSEIEDHNGKGCSTKHYAGEFWKYAHQVEAEVKRKYGS